MDLVSIITPLYNSSRFISETIESVLCQSYVNWEMIIVDDCSSDNSVDKVIQYANTDQRIKLIRLSKNVGAAEARNVALRIAKGRYIAFLDSDDLWLSNKLQRQIDFMLNNKVAFVFSGYERTSEDGTKILGIITVPEQIGYTNYLRNTIIGSLTVLIDKETIGYFEMPNIHSSHDMALWCVIFKRGYKAYGIKEILAKYREVSSSNTANKLKAARDVWRVYRELEKIGLLRSIIYFMCYSFNAIKKRL